MTEDAIEVGESRAIEARDSYGSHSGGGYGSYCPEGVPVELALLSVLGKQNKKCAKKKTA
jgi:hypothetical protein